MPSSTARSAVRERTQQVNLWLMLALTFTTGINDAVGYLGLDRVFTGNMTGNVVVLGMALAGGDSLPVLGPFLALIGFLAGAAIAGRLLKGRPGGWHGRTSAVFAAVSATMVVLGVLLLSRAEPYPRELAITVTTLAALAMGLQAAAARVVAVPDVTTVVVTSTLTGLAADSVLGSGKGGGSGRRSAAVLAILVGAVVGAALLKWHAGAALLCAGVLIAAATVIGDRYGN